MENALHLSKRPEFRETVDGDRGQNTVEFQLLEEEITWHWLDSATEERQMNTALVYRSLPTDMINGGYTA